MSSLRGGFKSVARGVTGTGGSGSGGKPQSTGRRVLGNLITVVLLLVALALILRRFGVLHR
jgi:hypothetical protein